MRKTPLCVAAILAASVLCVGIRPARAQVNFFDGTFSNPSWHATMILNPANNASFSSSQVASGGNLGSFRQVDHTLYTDWIGVSHLNSSFTYNPAFQGEITSIDVAYDLKEFAPLRGYQVVYGLLLFQGGTYYTAILDNLGQSGWTTFSHPGLTADSFWNRFDIQPLPGPGPEQPDFSSTGGAIEFGFLSGNTPVGFSPFSTSSGIDNLSITIHQIPEPGATILGGLALITMAIFRRQRLLVLQPH